MHRPTLVLVVVAGLSGCSKPEPIPEVHVTASPAGSTVKAESAADIAVGEGDWAWWRGAHLDAVSPSTSTPTKWDDSQHVIWKADVPGRGHSSPIVCADKIFLATADEGKKTQSLLAYDRATGKPLWNMVLHSGGLEHMHRKNSQASATPACDGRHVFMTFLNKRAIWLSAVDLEGHIAWQKEIGPFETIHGYAASPALYKGLVIVAADSNRGGFLAGVNRTSGEIVWRVQRADETSFSSPVVATISGRDQIVLSGGNSVIAYEPDTGDKLWFYSGGPSMTTSGTAAFDAEHVFVSGGHPDKQTLCIKADGSGDVTKTHVRWQNKDNFYVPSLLVHDGLVYGISDKGVGHCYDASTGKEYWTHRFGGDFSASPVLAGKHIYAADENGKVHVFQTGKTFQRVAENNLNDGGFATPAICDDQIFLRTDHRLYCLGSEK